MYIIYLWVWCRYRCIKNQTHIAEEKYKSFRVFIDRWHENVYISLRNYILKLINLKWFICSQNNTYCSLRYIGVYRISGIIFWKPKMLINIGYINIRRYNIIQLRLSLILQNYWSRTRICLSIFLKIKRHTNVPIRLYQQMIIWQIYILQTGSYFNYS